jgi:hypothetical protein
VCLRGDSLDKKIRKIFSGYKRTDFAKALKRKNALKQVEKTKYSVQIPGLHGLRFYAILLDEIR